MGFLGCAGFKQNETGLLEMGLLRTFGTLQEEGGGRPSQADGNPLCWGTMLAGDADLMERCLDEDMVGAGGPQPAGGPWASDSSP